MGPPRLVAIGPVDHVSVQFGGFVTWNVRAHPAGCTSFAAAATDEVDLSGAAEADGDGRTATGAAAASTAAAPITRRDRRR
ncbi:MAG TPA: hypothetical protein VF279_00605, partial [Acidimicrobiales bacterium]